MSVFRHYCQGCETYKATDAFYTSSPRTCKECVKARANAYRVANLERAQAYDMTTERRTADRRISPAIATFAITQYARLRQELAEARALAIEAHGGMSAALGESMRLRDAVAVTEALLADCRDSLTSAREECVRLREVNAALLAALARIAVGEVMTTHRTWTHADTVHEYQRIARAAIAKGAA